MDLLRLVKAAKIQVTHNKVKTKFKSHHENESITNSNFNMY